MSLGCAKEAKEPKEAEGVAADGAVDDTSAVQSALRRAASLGTRVSLALSLGLPVLLLAPTARAEQEPEPAWEKAPIQRRGGWTFGVDLSEGLAKIAGYPNDSLKIGKASSYRETSLAPSTRVGGWVGGTLTDYFGVGLGLSYDTFGPDDLRASTLGLGFHLEAFPAVSKGGAWRDIGLTLNAGLGLAKAQKGSADPAIDSGGGSILGAGAFWESWRLGGLALGPSLQGDYAWSPSARRGAMYLGLRGAFYEKP